MRRILIVLGLILAFAAPSHAQTDTATAVSADAVAAADVDGPELVSSTADPTAVQVALADQDVTVTLRVTDATGTQQVLARLWGVGQGVATPTKAATLVSGTPQDGTWRATFTIPQGSPDGVWQVYIVGMEDALSNVSSGLLIPASRLATVMVSSAHVPDAPEDVLVTPSDGKVTVSWSPPDDNGLPITSYVVSSDPEGLTKTVDGDQTSALFDGLANGTDYWFTVVAVNAVGPSDPSERAGAMPNAEFEVGPTATITGGLQARDVLTAHGGSPSPVPEQYRYQWYSDGTPIQDADDRDFTLTDSEIGHRMTVKVTASRTGYVDVSDLSDPTGVVTPGLTAEVSRPVVLAGRTVRVTATNLQPREPYTITIGGVVVKSAKATSHGTVSAYVRVARDLPEGWVKVVVTAASGRFDKKNVYAAHPATLTLVVTESSEHQNDAARLLVYGVGPGEKVKVTYDGRTISPRGAVADLGTIDGEGFYRLIFPVGSKLGKHTIKVTGLSYSRRGSATLTVVP